MYPINIENGMYMWTGTFNVTNNKHLCKYNVMKPVTLNTETPYLLNCDPHIEMNKNIQLKNEFKLV